MDKGEGKVKMKKVVKIIAPVLLLALIYFAINKGNGEDIEKGINITLKFQTVVDNKTEDIKTIHYPVDHEKTLGEVFDAINGKEIVIKLEGEKDSEWGRYISKINDFESNGQTAPFWFINSDTNSECISLGFCNGFDSQTLEADDIFEIVFE